MALYSFLDSSRLFFVPSLGTLVIVCVVLVDFRDALAVGGTDINASGLNAS